MQLTIFWLQIYSLGLVTFFLCAGTKLNQKLFVDVDSISFADPQRHGFLIILDDFFTKNFLQDLQFPILYLTVMRLSHFRPKHEKSGSPKNNGNENHRIVQILFPESLQEGKVIKVEGLQEKSWYQICLEFENMNRHNETTGVTCKLFRTLDKFGKPAESVVSDVKVMDIRSDALSLSLDVEADFDVKLTVYLSGSHQTTEAKLFVLNNSTKRLTVIFQKLQPSTDYGSLCTVEEPLPVRSSYTVLGRLARSAVERCHLAHLKTRPVPPMGGQSVDSAPLVSRALKRPRDHVVHDMGDEGGRWPRNGAICSLFVKVEILYIWFFVLLYLQR